MSKYKQHQNLVKSFKLLATQEIKNARFFDRHVGMFYNRAGTPVRINKAGMADLYGLIFFDNMIVHIEVEAKTGKAVQSKDQKTWEEFVGPHNYFLMRDAQETVDQIKEYIDVLITNCLQ